MHGLFILVCPIGKIYWDPNFKLVLHLVHGPLSVFFKVLAFIVWNIILVLHKLRSQRCFYTQSAQAWKIYALSIQLVYIQFMLLFSFVGPTVHNFFLAYFFIVHTMGPKKLVNSYKKKFTVTILPYVFKFFALRIVEKITDIILWNHKVTREFK